MKSKIVKLVGFFFLKYLLFYLILMFKNADYKLLKISNFKTLEDILYYIFLFFPLPLSNTIVFIAPLYYSLRARNYIVFALIFGCYLLLEYFIYTYLTSQQHIDANGVINSVLSLLVFGLMFFNELKSLNKTSTR
jgi:uncharacterized membrane protein